MKLGSIAAALLAVLLYSALATPQPVESSVANPPNPHFYYEFEGDLGDYADRLTLTTGEVRIGKILELGNMVYIWDKTTGKRQGFRRDEVSKMEPNRSERARTKPNLPDLTVAYIERLPRDQGWHAKVDYSTSEEKKGVGVLMINPEDYQLHPEPGQMVTFRIHILNVGRAATKPFSYSVWMDDSPLTSGRVATAISPGGESVAELKWEWQEGQHYIKVLLDTQGEMDEIAEWNNTFIDPVRALTFFFIVGKNRHDLFANSLNLVDTFSFEDWAQYHVHGMNWLFERSIWPSAPDGILERVRIDKIVVAENYDDPDSKAKWDRERRANDDPEGPIMFNGNWDFGESPAEGEEGREEAVAQIARWAGGHDWGLPHELGHQLGLVDLYWMNHGMRDVLVRNKDGNYQNVMHFYPWPQMMMHWHGPHIFSEIHAGYLNYTLGRPRGFFGDFYYQIPKKNYVRVYSNTGRPLSGVEITLYQRWTNPSNTFIVGDWKAPWAYGPDPVFSGRTDAQGKYLLPNQKVTPHDTPEPGYHLSDNPWGLINVVGDNVLFLAKVSYGGMEEFYWLRLHDACVGYLRGDSDEYSFDLYTRFADNGAPKPPTDVQPRFQVRANKQEQPGLTLVWKPSPSPDIVEYRCYHRAGHGGMESKQYRLFAVVDADKLRNDGLYAQAAEYWYQLRRNQGHYGSDSYLAVTAVDSRGRESNLSRVIYIPNWSAHNVNVRKVAQAPDGRFFISINGGETQMLTWTESDGLREVGFREAEVPHGFPGFVGIAFDSEGRLVATEQARNRIGLWTVNGDVIKVSGEKGEGDGQFNRPSDVAIDGKGRIFVADTLNHRVQVFDADLNFLFKFGSQGNGEMQFEEPSALGILGDKLAVTDTRLGRVLVFDISGDEPKQVLEIPKTGWMADRAYVAPSGNVYITDATGVVVYKPDGSILRTISQTPTGGMYFPRGMYVDKDGNGWIVNALPFASIMKIELK